MTKDFSSTDTSEVSLVNLFSLYGAYERNTLNDRQFSTKGSFLKFSLRAGYGSESYSPGSTRSDSEREDKLLLVFGTLRKHGYMPLNEGFSLGYHYVMHAEFKPLLSNYFSSIIEAPAFQPNLITKSLFMENYRANQYIGVGLMPVYAFGKNMHAKWKYMAIFLLQEILQGCRK